MTNKKPAYQFGVLDPEQDWPFFDKDFVISDSLWARIFPLTKKSAEQLWCREVSLRPLERHPMLLPSMHWVNPDQCGPNWEPEWNSDSGSEVQQFLRQQFPLPDEETVYFMLAREHAYAVPIGVFIECWRAFLGVGDEGPILLHPASGYYACFGPNGALHADQRESWKPMAQVSRSTASLRIIGDDLVPDDVTRLLGCEPTRAQRKGEELIGTTTGRIRVARFGMWQLQLAQREPEGLDGMVNELLNRLPAPIEVWIGLAKKFELDLFCGLFMNQANEGLSVSPKTLIALGSRGIELSFDIYGPTEEDD